MLDHHLRRQPTIKLVVGQSIMLPGICVIQFWSCLLANKISSYEHVFSKEWSWALHFFTASCEMLQWFTSSGWLTMCNCDFCDFNLIIMCAVGLPGLIEALSAAVRTNRLHSEDRLQSDSLQFVLRNTSCGRQRAAAAKRRATQHQAAAGQEIHSVLYERWIGWFNPLTAVQGHYNHAFF